MNASIKQFITFLTEAKALQFGEFTLKSGRVSPYFFNSARFETGRLIGKLGEFYAEAITQKEPETNIVFGPAYKGIPLALATAMAMSPHGGVKKEASEVGYLFNRKEAKTHGDKGLFVGRPPTAEDSVTMVDDVMTDGATKKEAVELLETQFGVRPKLVAIAFDRMEQNATGGDALLEFQESTGIPVVSLLNLADLEQALAEDEGIAPPGMKEKISAYRKTFGVQGR